MSDEDKKQPGQDDPSGKGERRPRRDDGARKDGPRSGGPRSGAPRSDRPRRDGDARPPRTGGAGGAGRPTGGAGGAGRPAGAGTGRPVRSGFSGAGRPDRGGRPDRPGAPRGASTGREGRSDSWGQRDSELTPEQMRARALKRVRERHEDPYIDADVTPEMLIKSAYNDLKTLDKENADVVARHLVMVARLLDEDPEKAHMHAISASRRGGRIGLTRETLGITAYTIGDFALALRELKTYQRITGRDDQIALMVDSERGVGRPDKALEVGRSVDRTKLDDSVQVNLAIAMSGARLDLEQTELALAELEIPQLRADKAYAYHAPLYFAYGDVLAELGREEEAAKWERRGELLDAALDKREIDGGTDESMGIETEYETVVEEFVVEEVASEEVASEEEANEEAEPEAPADEASDA